MRARSFAAPAFRAALAALVIGLLPMAGVQADELQDVGKLVKGNQLDEAERRADTFLKANPKDAQMRFLKGVILTQRGRRDEAAAVFTALTQDYPELPEPYNNLAVIHASQGAYEKARIALETAIRVTPDYATAYENLGDVYAALAARSYETTRRLDGANAPAQRKLDAARAVLSGTMAKAPEAAAVAAKPTPSPTSTSAAPRSQSTVGLPSPASARASVQGVGATAPDIIVPADSQPVPSGSNVVAIELPAVAESSETTSRPALAAAGASDADRTRPVNDVTAAVQRWAASRAVKVEGLAIRVDGDTAVARFREIAARATTAKVLTLMRAGSDWTVTGERVEP